MDAQLPGPRRPQAGPAADTAVAPPSIADGLARLCLRQVDRDTRERAVLHVIAWTGAAALAAAGPLADRLWRAAGLQDEESPGSDREAGRPVLRDLLFEASLGSLHEIDDTHRAALVHPGPVIVPLALHLARLYGASGEAALDAVVRGYEAMIRLGAAVGPRHYQYWHNTATCGAVGAAAAAASLMRLDEPGTAAALRLAATQAAGLWQIRLDDCDAKPWHTSHAALTGLRAARLAAAGLRGPLRAFEGEKGLFAAMCPGAQAGDVLAGAAAPWRIHEVSFKPWTACRHAHPAIDAALAVHRRHGRALAAADVAGVRVATYGDAIAFCDRVHPVDAGQARFSLQHVVALALRHGQLDPAHFEPPYLSAPDIAALRERVALAVDARWQGRYPAHFGAGIALVLADGCTLAAESPDAPGDPERPLSPEDVSSLADALMESAGWPAGLRRARLQGCARLAEGADCKALPPLRPGTAPEAAP